MCIDSIASEIEVQSDLDGDRSLELANELDDEAYWSALLDDAYQLQLETADEDVDEGLQESGWGLDEDALR
jgi:hypothetical protein